MGLKSAVISKNNCMIKVSRNRLKPCYFRPLKLQNLDSLLSSFNMGTDSARDAGDNIPGPIDPGLAERGDEHEEEALGRLRLLVNYRVSNRRRTRAART